MGKSVYLLKENGELFGIHSSKDGFVIALRDFDYPGIHLTVYIKKLPSNDEEFLMDIHLTDESKKSMSASIFKRKFNVNKIRRIFIKKLMRLIKISKYYSDKFKGLNTKKNIFCIDCLRENKKFDINTRKKAEKTYGLNYLKELSKFPICNNEKHRILYDTNSNQMYLKFFNGIISIKDAEEYRFAIERLFRREIEFCQKMFKEIEVKFKENVKALIGIGRREDEKKRSK